MANQKQPRIPLPKSWTKWVRSALLHVVSLAQYATAYTCSWAAGSVNPRLRLLAENDQLHQEILLLREELCIHRARMGRIPAQRRPHYASTERMAILELRAACGWSIKQAADAFLVTPATIASWMRRIDEQGPDALLQLGGPVNKFPDFVRYAVQRLKALCPSMGKVRIAQTLRRAGLHLGATTVGRILKEPPRRRSRDALVATGRVVTARTANHVWHVDLTVVPTGAGFSASWLPFALPQCWPFCWWVGVVLDHFSRRVLGMAIFGQRPDSPSVRMALGRIIARTKTMPKYLICDKDSVFFCDGFRRWLRRKGTKPRFGAVGQHGSIAVIERFIRTLKDEGTRRITVPLRRDAFRRELNWFVARYNEHRPNMGLDGKTPNEVYFGRRPGNRRPRIEPRRRWTRRSRCAVPQVLVAGQPRDRLTIQLAYHASRRHLPVVTLKRAA
jgi:transposase InsO family protein